VSEPKADAYEDLVQLDTMRELRMDLDALRETATMTNNHEANAQLKVGVAVCMGLEAIVQRLDALREGSRLNRPPATGQRPGAPGLMARVCKPKRHARPARGWACVDAETGQICIHNVYGTRGDANIAMKESPSFYSRVVRIRVEEVQ